MMSTPCEQKEEIKDMKTQMAKMSTDVAIISDFIKNGKIESAYWRGLVISCVLSLVVMAFTFWGAYNRLELTVEYKCGKVEASANEHPHGAAYAAEIP